MEWFTLTIDGREVSVPKGTTVLEACRMHNIPIPTLCHDPELTPAGSCRLCIVQIEGMRNLPPSCVTQVSQGMVVETQNLKVRAARKTILELLVANHPLNCMTCQKMGDCSLAKYAYEYGVTGELYQGERRSLPLDDGNPFIVRNPNKCVLCGKCIRVCEEIQGRSVLDFSFRGFDTQVGPAFNLPYHESDCVFCGSCVSVCPVGALSEKKMVGEGRPWEVKKVQTTCPFCGTGCNFDLNVKDGKVIGVTSNPNAPVNGKALCVKGRFGMDMINNPNRLTTPLIRKDGVLVPAEWDEALDLVAAKFREIKENYGANALAALSSAHCTNEENYLLQKFMRGVIGTNNIDHCARVCHAPTVAGLAVSFGSGASTNSFEEIPNAKVMFVIGANPTEAHPVVGTKMKQALAKGAKLIVADPRQIELAESSHLWLRLRPGTDVALINGIMNIILANGWEDPSFIEARTEGFDKFGENLENYPPEKVSQITGVPVEQLEEAARIYATAERAMIFYTLGITEHTTGTDNVMSLANLAMLTGNVGKECSGVNPLRGQNNVQGSCDMGALPGDYPGYQKVVNPEVRKKFEEAWGVSLDPNIGLMLPDMFKAAINRDLRAMYIMGEDPVITDADANHVRKGLESLDFLVVQDIFMSETAKLADVVLPGASFAEKTGTFTNAERRVQMVNQAIKPIGNARTDGEIIIELANRMGYPSSYESSEEVMQEIASLTPLYGGISHQRLGTQGLQWPVPSLDHPGSKVLHQETFSRGKGLFMPIEYQAANELPDEEYPFVLNTGRKLSHYNVFTQNSEALESYSPEELAEINPLDAQQLDVKEGERVKVVSRRGELETKIRITERVPQGMIFMTFHYMETPTNVLTNGAADKVSKTYEYKACGVRITKTA
ncbi:formate dehydrogenase, alpha subunit, archaeal-type [Desulfosporosinus orientis DSM 765]|uniref:Formate dehydrogenase, alpha subunit, archaeal-type n=1 Tax=Desulfosporosinus orientis (strain ATCC 19365 / DSM 765 / NCIMB 8382 / VKM B-1628 / Singapore I) TaxID=768706 RepID=G7W9H2_DESOD|nr:formate dehydrogenase subunit alpha [Desulfosporosinus orientis]AET69889.1 formate dehydrogenase, alpha subunit, archaeal-type [Desulfosporosinus orientis DSM 765]